MSTHLDFYCRTCRTRAGYTKHRLTDDNTKLFERLLGLREHVILLRPVETILFDHNLAQFFLDHDGRDPGKPAHDIVIEDGFGRQWLVDQQRWTSVTTWEMEHPEEG